MLYIPETPIFDHDTEEPFASPPVDSFSLAAMESKPFSTLKWYVIVKGFKEKNTHR